MDEFKVLRTIARKVDSTNQRVGQLLTEHGYRNGAGNPTFLAHQHGSVRKYHLASGHPGWLWSEPKVLDFLHALESRHPGTITPKKVPTKRRNQ